MQDTPWALDRLIAPTTSKAFFEEYWERAPLHASHPPDYFAGLFGIEDMDYLVSLPGLVESDNFRLLNIDAPGDVLPFDGGCGTLSQAHVYHAFDRGSTINVLGLHRFWPRVGAFCRDLEETLHHRSYCNLFFTPPGAKQLHAHYDDQDVLILQLAGSKRWQVDRNCFPLPLRGDNADVAMGNDIVEFIVDQGDVLYLPRGFVHQPMVLDASSLHLTVGITPHRWADLLLSMVVTAAQRHQDLRRALPPGVLFDSARHQELEPGLRQLAALCLEDLRVDDAAGHLAAGSLGEMHPVPSEHFARLVHRDLINTTTPLVRRPGMTCLVRIADGRAAIQFPGNQVFGPTSIKPALEYIATAPGSFTAADLPELTGASALTLVRQLVLEGLLAAHPAAAG